MNELTFQSQNLDDTQRLGVALAAALPAGSVVALNGTLGAGKTRLVQSVGEALHVPADTVLSPTFVLIQEYQGEKSVYHFDAYRLRDADEFLELGPEEYFHGNGICFVEWAEKVADCLPPEYLEIRIEVCGDTQREFLLSAHGGAYAEFLSTISRTLAD